MARKFDIDFDYKNKKYTASVLMESAPESPVCINLPDAELHKILPEGKFYLDGKDFKVKESQVSDTELVDVIVEAIQKHEADVPNRSLWN